MKYNCISSELYDQSDKYYNGRKKRIVLHAANSILSYSRLIWIQNKEIDKCFNPNTHTHTHTHTRTHTYTHTAPWRRSSITYLNHFFLLHRTSVWFSIASKTDQVASLHIISISKCWLSPAWQLCFKLLLQCCVTKGP